MKKLNKKELEILTYIANYESEFGPVLFDTVVNALIEMSEVTPGAKMPETIDTIIHRLVEHRYLTDLPEEKIRLKTTPEGLKKLEENRQ